MERIVKLLKESKKTISTMESCTGGGVVNSITNVEGASDVIKFSAITYSNEFKIKMGVSNEIIDKYSVYSIEVAREMSKKISDFTSSDFGIGVTGKLNRVDKNNFFGEDNVVYISIYNKNTNEFLDESIKVTSFNRVENKKIVISRIVELLESCFN